MLIRLLVPVLLLALMGVTPPAAAEGPSADRTIDVGLRWRTKAGKLHRESLVSTSVAQAASDGLWVATAKIDGRLVPGVLHRGAFVVSSAAVETMTSLDVELTVHEGKKRYFHRSTLFDASRPFGASTFDPSDLLHVLVVPGYAGDQTLTSKLEDRLTSSVVDAGALWRTRRLARNYIGQSDRKTAQYGKAFGVKPDFDRTRIVVVRESWLTVEGKAPASSGSPFGDLGRALGGGGKPKPRRFPVYGIDVVDNFLRASGKNRIAFHTARSSFNDVLEGKVLYEATGTSRRVLTASGVLAQMHQNRAKHGSKNHVLTVDRDNAERLTRVKGLAPHAQASIRSFVTRNPTWNVQITQAPVVFREKNKPIYALHAWFQVHPQSGRRVGILPDGSRGGMTDEIARLARAGLERARDAVVARTGPAGGAVKGFFSQIRGMYVGSAGVIEGISLTMANPEVAALSGTSYTKFLALHALAHAQKFLEDNAWQYDTYAAQLSFWQGVLVVTAELGGREGIEDLARRAGDGVRRKAFDDARGKAKEAIRDALAGS